MNVVFNLEYAEAQMLILSVQSSEMYITSRPFEKWKLVQLSLETNAILKYIYCQLFLQQNWVHVGSAENYNSGSAITVSHTQVSAREGELFYRKGK